MPFEATTDPTLAFPRILCLHGGGTTSEIFRSQCRALAPLLSSKFRLVYADAPFLCDAGPGMIPTYEGCGPYRRWLRWLSSHRELDGQVISEEIAYAIETCKREDNGTGPWVGLLGFSQGAKIAASLLFEQQLQQEKLGKAETDYKFAILMAGRAPLVSLSELSRAEAGISLQDAGTIAEGTGYDDVDKTNATLRLPTIHVHGLQDPGLDLHRRLLTQYCAPESATVVEWDGAHRIPFKTTDVELVVQAILKVAEECG